MLCCCCRKIFCFLLNGQNCIQSRLTSNLCPQDHPWISDTPVPVFHGLGLQGCVLMPDVCDSGRIQSRTPCILGKHYDWATFPTPFFLEVFFLNRVSLCNPSCLWTCYTPPASTSKLLGLPVWHKAWFYCCSLFVYKSFTYSSLFLDALLVYYTCKWYLNFITFSNVEKQFWFIKINDSCSNHAESVLLVFPMILLFF